MAFKAYVNERWLVAFLESKAIEAEESPDFVGPRLPMFSPPGEPSRDIASDCFDPLPPVIFKLGKQ